MKITYGFSNYWGESTIVAITFRIIFHYYAAGNLFNI